MYKFTAWYGSFGRFDRDSEIITLHSSFTSGSHGMGRRKVHSFLQNWILSVSAEVRKSLVRWSSGAPYITLGRPLGLLTFFDGLMVCVFQTCAVSSSSSYNTTVIKQLLIELVYSKMYIMPSFTQSHCFKHPDICGKQKMADSAVNIHKKQQQTKKSYVLDCLKQYDVSRE